MSYTQSIEQRLHFLGFDKQTTACLKNIQPILESSIDKVLDCFYEQLIQDPEILALFPTNESIVAARNAQRVHWIDILFSGETGKTHFENAELFGKEHESMGLSLGIYLGGYCIMMNQFIRVISEHFHEDNEGMTQMIHALHKAVFLDIDTVIDSYLEEKNHAMRKVLLHAEKFSASLKKINCVLAKKAIDHQTNLSALSTYAKILDQQMLQLDQKISEVQPHDSVSAEKSNQELTVLLQESTVLLEANQEIYLELDIANEQAIQIATEVNSLNSNYDQIQNENKCHFTAISEKPVLQKIKALFSRRLH